MPKEMDDETFRAGWLAGMAAAEFLVREQHERIMRVTMRNGDLRSDALADVAARLYDENASYVAMYASAKKEAL